MAKPNSLIIKAIELIIIFTIFSCNNTNQTKYSTTDNKKFKFEIIDSILVDNLEKLFIMDAAENFDEFLALNQKTDEVLIFNKKGKIINTFQNHKDTPEAINNIFSMSLLNNKDILIGGNQLNLGIYNRNGKQKLKIKLPLLSPRGSHLSHKQIFEIEDNRYVGNIPAYPDSSFSKGLLKPTLLFIDTKNKSKTKSILKIPLSSKYSDEKFHGYVHPIINYFEEKLFISYQNETKLHVYNYKNKDFIFDKTINFEIKDFVQIIPSSNEGTYNFDKNHRESTPGRIWRIFCNKNNTFILYTKGIAESKFNNQIKDAKEFLKSDPFYILALNDNLEVTQKNILVPLYITSDLLAVSEDGTFIGRKNPLFSTIEDENEVFYLFQLNPNKQYEN